jgi:hypothetical protein
LLSRNLGTLTSWNPLGLSRPVMGLLYLFIILNTSRLHSCRCKQHAKDTPIKCRKIKKKPSLQTYEFQVHESIIYGKTNLVSFVHLKRSFLSTGWTNPFKRKSTKLLRIATLLFTSRSRFRRLRCHITNNEVFFSFFFKSTFPHDCLLTFDWFLSAPGCFWKKRKLSPQPYGRTVCAWSPSSAATRGWVLMHVEHEIPRKCTDKLHTPRRWNQTMTFSLPQPIFRLSSR